MSKSKRALLIFTRIPVAGKVKTRLMTSLSPQECAAIQEAMVYDLIEKLSILEKENHCDMFLCFSDETEPTAFLSQLPSWLHVFPQEGDDIGERMQHGFGVLFSKGYEQVVLTGSDIPTVHAPVIQNAFAKLSETDVVLGPSCDGGYYLLGANQMELRPIFTGSDLAWGKSSVYEQTLSKCHRQKWTVSEVDQLLDIDEPDDLAQYRHDPLKDNNHLNEWLLLNDA